MPLSNLTVLAVDDNVAHCYALTRTLESCRAKVVPAHTGIDTLKFANELPDVILLDVNLPDLDGFEVCRRLKADPKTAQIPVIFITATYHSTSARSQAESVGAATILFHPVAKDHLVTVIEGQVRRSKKPGND